MNGLEAARTRRSVCARNSARSQIDRHLAGGNSLGWAGEPFDLRDHSQVRNEFAAAAEVAGGDGADQAGQRTLQRFGSREGQLVGAVQVAGAQCGFADLQAFEDLALHRGSQPLDLLEAVFARCGLERREVGNAELLVEDVDLLRLQPGRDRGYRRRYLMRRLALISR